MKAKIASWKKSFQSVLGSGHNTKLVSTAQEHDSARVQERADPVENLPVEILERLLAVDRYTARIHLLHALCAVNRTWHHQFQPMLYSDIRASLLGQEKTALLLRTLFCRPDLAAVVSSLDLTFRGGDLQLGPIHPSELSRSRAREGRAAHIGQLTAFALLTRCINIRYLGLSAFSLIAGVYTSHQKICADLVSSPPNTSSIANLTQLREVSIVGLRGLNSPFLVANTHLYPTHC